MPLPPVRRGRKPRLLARGVPLTDVDARLEALFLARDAGEPMERRERVEAVEGGLAGDRYQTGRGHYAPLDSCEVTLVDRAALDRVHEGSGVDLSAGQHRRNLVGGGVAVDDLLGATFSVGGATVRGTRRRPPCAYLESVAEPDPRTAGERIAERVPRDGTQAGHDDR